MLRFYYLVICFIPLILFYIIKANYYCAHEDRYDENKRYGLAIQIMEDLKKKGHISTVSYGEDNLPKDGGYIMYANHQGKYDALGIMTCHDSPCSVVMDAERSRVLLTNQVMNLVHGIRLERHDFKQQMNELGRMTDEAKEGRKFIYFPEGKYEHNGNHLQEFRPGAFKVAKTAKCPIVPVAIYDSHIPFDFNSLRKVTTQVHFMDPIYYDDYAEMSTKEISEMVKERIEAKLADLEKNRKDCGYNRWFKEYREMS